jgi:hypothetical protein
MTMGTRSITRIFDHGEYSKDKDTPLLTLYRQFDGYPDGMGKDLADFICTREVVNGLTDSRMVFNGAGCFAAALIAHLKKGPGGIYVYPPNTESEAFEYQVIVQSPGLPMLVRVLARNDVLFAGTAEHLQSWVENYFDEDADDYRREINNDLFPKGE